MSAPHAFGRAARFAVLSPPVVFLALFFLAPFLFVARISLSQSTRAQPPYAPQYEQGSGLEGLRAVLEGLNFENYATILSDDLYLSAFLTALRIAATSTFLLLLIAYPIAYAMARARPALRPLLLALMIVPFWTSFLIRIYAWIGILKPEGLLNQALLALGLIDAPLEILNTEIAIYIGIVYAYLPFMVLPIYAVLVAQSHDLLEAAADLGCPPWKSFWLVTVPLSAPGVAAGCLLVFIPCVGEFVIPDLLGGSETLMIGRQLWSEFFGNRDWPTASAIAVILVIILLIPFLILRRLEARGEEALK
ncbi:ABC transporter permease [Terrarubrum flagellatum]|uniref:ABC transporter permease n=1 Tax=Terrirubrum flagellatum TaxID=2895980 RepID=UPI0031452658